MNTKNTTGFVFALTIIFMVLNLTGAITWSWVWVFSPLWITAILSVAAIVVMFTIFNILDYLEARRSDDE